MCITRVAKHLLHHYSRVCVAWHFLAWAHPCRLTSFRRVIKCLLPLLFVVTIWPNRTRLLLFGISVSNSLSGTLCVWGRGVRIVSLYHSDNFWRLRNNSLCPSLFTLISFTVWLVVLSSCIGIVILWISATYRAFYASNEKHLFSITNLVSLSYVL